MSGEFVIDNSVVMSWCFEDEKSAYADAVLDALKTSRALVPGLWALETTNVLVVAERKKRIHKADAEKFLVLLRSLPIAVESETPTRIWDSIYPLARATGLTSYDAAYLDLARREDIPLATLDLNLQKASRKAGVRLFRAEK